MRKKTKIMVTAVAMVLVLSAMVVGVWAASTQNQGFTARVSFTATDITCEVFGQVFGTTETTQPSWNDSVSPTDSTETPGGTLTWDLTNSGTTTLIPADTIGTNPSIRFCFAIRNLVTSATGTKIYVIPTMTATAVTNMSISYKQVVTTKASALASTDIDATTDTWPTAATAATASTLVMGSGSKYLKTSTFGLTNTTTKNGIGYNGVFYFEVIYTVVDSTVNVTATNISFNLMLCSESKVTDYITASA